MTSHSRSIQDLVAKIKSIPRESYEYFEVKQMAEILARHRERVRASLAEYRALKSAMARENDAVEKLYQGYEAMFQRDHMRDSWRLYRLISNDFHTAYNAYMKAVKNSPTLPEAYRFNMNAPKANDTQKPQNGRSVA